jgi:hypothetical protein
MPSRLAAVILLVTASAFAQTNRGSIAGTVTDKSGSAVPGANVVVTNQGTNEVFRTKTSESGAFTVPNLDPVSYRVEIAAEGFKTALVESVKVDTASTASVNIPLETGSVKTETPMLNTESGVSGQTVTQAQIENSPLVNRSVLDLALTVPNVTGDANSEDYSFTSGAAVPGYNMSVNGGRLGSSMMMADGVNNTGVGIARSVVSFSPETVQEFTVQTNSFSAEFSRSGGGIINTTTKAGTNEYHGSALWYQRNPATNAAPYTTATSNRPVSDTRSNQFSLAVGGPVRIPKVYNGTNKTFFFAAYEPRYLTDHQTGYGTVPTDAMRGGDFSNTVRVNSDGNDSSPVPASVAALFPGVVTSDATLYQHFGVNGNQFTTLPAPGSNATYVPLPGNIIPKNMLDPVSQNLLQYVPKSNSAWFLSPSGNLSNLVIQRNLTNNYQRYTARIDQVVSDKNHLNFRITSVPSIAQVNYGIPANGSTGNYSWGKQLMAADTHIISASIVNDLRLNYTRGRFSGTFASQYDAKTGENLSLENGLPSLTTGGLPSMAIGLGTYGGIGAGGSTLGDNVEERYNIADAVYISHGAFSIRAGVDLTHELLNTVNYYEAAGGVYAFRNYQTNSTGASSAPGGIQFASFLLGVPNQVTMYSALLPYYYRWNSGAAWVQNDWKATSHLTLNLGLRYQLQLPRTEKFDHQGSFLPQLAQQVTLPQPLTLLTGQTITSALVPPFGMDGMGGRSRYLWPADYRDFEPRFGFAYAPHIFGLDGKLIVRGGYGLSHSPLNGQNRVPMPAFSSSSTSPTTANPANAMRLSSNPPVVQAQTWDQVLQGMQLPSNGLITNGSINMTSQGFAISGNMKTPYSQSWNLTLAYQATSNGVLEIAYVGNKGTHLFMPSTNQNATSIDYVNALQANNQNPTTTVADPLGRLGTNGKVLTVQQGTLASTYLGFVNLYTRWDASADSIRHAAYISYVQRARHGLTLTTNYTFGKSIDDASDSGADAGITSVAKTIAGGSTNFGGTRALDRSVSTFDVKHSFVASFMYEVPVGRRRALFGAMPKGLNAIFGEWDLAGIERLRSGAPFMPVLHDNNGLGDNSSGSEYSLRPDIVSGVPVVNPLWRSSCPLTNLCEPFVNPAAFERPALGELGNAPRTIDGARGPMQNYFDASVQKNFSFKEGKARLQFRVDLLNAFNHPLFAMPTGYGGNSSFMALPSSSPITAAQYDSWAAANNQPLSATPAGQANLTQVQNLVIGSRNAKGALPANFFTVPLPQGFASAGLNSFNITTMNGYKLYALKNAYSNTFGVLNSKGIPRYIQFGLKFYF